MHPWLDACVFPLVCGVGSSQRLRTSCPFAAPDWAPPWVRGRVKGSGGNLRAGPPPRRTAPGGSSTEASPGRESARGGRPRRAPSLAAERGGAGRLKILSGASTKSTTPVYAGRHRADEPARQGRTGSSSRRDLRRTPGLLGKSGPTADSGLDGRVWAPQGVRGRTGSRTRVVESRGELPSSGVSTGARPDGPSRPVRARWTAPRGSGKVRVRRGRPGREGRSPRGPSGSRGRPGSPGVGGSVRVRHRWGFS